MSTRAYASKELLCNSQCLNIGHDQRENLNCKNAKGENKPDVQNRIDPINRDDADGEIKLCDIVCDTWNCYDESLCNGYMYGRVCISGRFAGLVINPPYELCNDEPGCYNSDFDNNTHYDEKWCDPNAKDSHNCISGDMLKKNNTMRKLIPIFNYTRCSAILWSAWKYMARYQVNVVKSGTPYCENYIDQTNCTDETRVAVSCYIQGYGYSTISKTMVCGKFRRKFCIDGMDIACVDVDRSCTLHKHQLCDGFEDCSTGSDERHPWCSSMTNETCYRNYRTNRKLQIPASWLHDNMVDCLDGLDEHWDIRCGLTVATKRYEVTAICEDVFLCKYEAKYIRLKQLCNGIEKCDRENLICGIGRGLSRMSNFIPRQRTKSITISFCLKGLEHLAKMISSCHSREFNPFDEEVFGISNRTAVSLPMKKADCRFLFGELYVILSCLGNCENSECPLKKPVDFRDCPLQFNRRIYTVVNKNRLTFVQRGSNDYNNDFFVCANGMCTDYNKVCNLWDDCGDGSDEKNCSNNFICKDNQGILPITKKCDGYPDCWDISDECNSECSMNIIDQSILKGAAWSIGLIAVLSNIIALYENARSLKECLTGQALANKLLIILIGIGDFLIGGYLVSIAVTDSFIYGDDYCSRRFEWLSSRYCSSLGVISTFGSFLSLFSLTILSIIRAFKLVCGDLQQRPESRDISSKEYVKIAALMISITAVVATISSLSLLGVLEDFFVNGLVYDESVKIFHGQIGKSKHLKVIQSYYGRSRNRTLSWKQIKRLVGSMFSNDYGNLEGKVSRVDFFGNDGVCLFKFFVTPDDSQKIFTMVILAISIFCFAVVSAAYITINVITTKSSKSLLLSSGPTANVVKKRNQKLQRKIATIISTDFLCWVPFVLVCFLHYYGVLDATAQYGLFSIVILPINSIINPFLYSEMMQNFAGRIWIKFRSLIKLFVIKLAKFISSKAQEGEQTRGPSALQGDINDLELIPMTVIGHGQETTVATVRLKNNEDGKLGSVADKSENDEVKTQETEITERKPSQKKGCLGKNTNSEPDICQQPVKAAQREHDEGEERCSVADDHSKTQDAKFAQKDANQRKGYVRKGRDKTELETYEEKAVKTAKDEDEHLCPVAENSFTKNDSDKKQAG